MSIYLILAIAGIILLFFIAAIVAAIVMITKKLWPFVHYRKADGVIIKVESLGSSGRPIVAFKDARGAQYTALKNHYSDAYSQSSIGQPALVFYDPNDPQNNYVYQLYDIVIWVAMTIMALFILSIFIPPLRAPTIFTSALLLLIYGINSATKSLYYTIYANRTHGTITSVELSIVPDTEILMGKPTVEFTSINGRKAFITTHYFSSVYSKDHIGSAVLVLYFPGKESSALIGRWSDMFFSQLICIIIGGVFLCLM